MNHIYQLKFDQNLLELIVVSELATNTEAKSQAVTLVPDFNPDFNLTSGSLYDHAFMSVVNYLSLVLFNLPSLSLINTNYRPAMSSHNDSAGALLLDANSDVNSNLYTNKFKAVNHSAYQFSAKNILALSLLASSFGVATNVLATPTITGPHNQVGTVVSGSVDAVTNGFTTTIHQTTDKAIIDWNKSFDINANEIVEFVQKSKDSAVLNRVLGDQVTNILGALKSNGQVFIVNPHGIVFGQNSHVDVGGLVASTLNINQDDFLNGHYVFNKDKDQAITKVLNSGVIKIKDDGSLALIGGQVVNNGVLESKNGTVFLLAGNSIEIADLHNPLVSYKVTAKNKAVNLGGILSNGAILLGNQVLNGKPSRYTTSTFADVIGSTQANANQVNITSTGEVVLYGGSVADEMQSSDQTDAQVLGERNSIVENNAVIIDKSNDKPTVKILGDYVHTASESKITASRYTIAGGSVLIGGGFHQGENKLATLDIASPRSVIDVSFTRSGTQRGSNVVFRGKHTYLDGHIFANSLYDLPRNLIITSGKEQLTLGDDFSISTIKSFWLLNSDYLAVVGSPTAFQNKYHNQPVTIDGRKVYEQPVLNPSELLVDVFADYYDKFDNSNTFTYDQLQNANSYHIELNANKGLYLGNLSNLPTAQLLLHTKEDKGTILIQDSQPSRYYSNFKVGSEFESFPTNNNDNYLDALYIDNSTLSVVNLEVNQVDKVKITNSTLKTSSMYFTYANPNVFAKEDQSSIEVINSDLSAKGNPFELKSNSIHVENSSFSSNGNITFLSEERFGKNITINHTHITAEDSIQLNTYTANLTITNSRFSGTGVLSYIDLGAKPTTTVKNPIVNLQNSRINAGDRINVGNDYNNQIKTLNVTLATQNISLGGSDVNLVDSYFTVNHNIDLNATNLFTDNLTTYADINTTFRNHKVDLQNTKLLAKHHLNFTYNPDHTNNDLDIVNFNNVTINTDGLGLDLNAKGKFSANKSVINSNVTSLEVNTGSIDLVHTNITTGNGLALTTLKDLTITDHSHLLSQANQNLLVNNNVTLTNSELNTTLGAIEIKALGSYRLEGDKVTAKGLINIVSDNSSLVDKNDLHSDLGVNLSTADGDGTLFIGKNDFNDNQPIKVNADTTNPVVCIYGKDTSHYYTSYHHQGGLCLDDGVPKPKPVSKPNTVTVVTQNPVDNTPTNPNPVDIALPKDFDFNVPLGISIDDLDILSTCRPRFVDIVSKRNIAFTDIMYGNKNALIYQYKLTSEQADFLFNCYARNVGYFSNLYNR